VSGVCMVGTERVSWCIYGGNIESEWVYIWWEQRESEWVYIWWEQRE
jgi:hypothetical protein